MPQVFISYSSKDKDQARELHSALKEAGAEPFLAEVDLAPGTSWKKSILKNLKEAKWVFFLATPSSCSSQAVSHEIGASLALEKKLIPLMSGVRPSQLPEWVSDKQAVDAHDSKRIKTLVEEVGQTVKSDRFWTGIVVAGLICFGLWIVTRKRL